MIAASVALTLLLSGCVTGSSTDNVAQLEPGVTRPEVGSSQSFFAPGAKTVPGTTVAPNLGPAEPALAVTSDFPEDDARTLFAHGFGSVASRYIETVSIDRFAIEGLKGLSSLDPAITVQASSSDIQLIRQGVPLRSFERPLKEDASGWGDLTANVLKTAHYAVPELAAAEPEELYEAVFDAALAGLDPFSRYAGAEEARLNRGSRNGFGGIGIVYDLETAGVRVSRVLPDSPAERGGLKSGDVITAIDGAPVERMDRREVRERLRGPASSSVRVTILPALGGGPQIRSLERSLIVLPTVESRVDRGIAIVELTSFNQRTTSAVADALAQSRQQTGGGLGGIIIDMRGNPGGLLDQAVTTSDLFINQGPIVSTRGRHPDARQFYAATGGDIASGVPMVVLIDGDSASAAEIVAAALQDNGRAVVIGTASYGKGTVQTVIQLPNGGEITLTWSRFYSPSGYVLHGLGVLPVACTSGYESTSAPEAADTVLADMRTGQTDIAARLALWRSTVTVSDGVRRHSLRSNCPAEHHQEAGVDLVVADRLLRDNDLYDRVLRLAAPQQALTWTNEALGADFPNYP